MAGIVIIGAGECGARAAFALRERGCEGDVTLIGSEIHAPYERPPLSKEITGGIVRQKTIVTAEQCAAAKIALKTGITANAINRTTKTVFQSDSTTLQYDKLILATGASPRRLPLAEGKPVLYLRSIEDAQAILGNLGPGQHLAIVGAGFIGLELASTASRLRAKVTVIEALPRPMGRAVLPEIADLMATRHKAEGVTILCDTGITAIGDDRAITLANGTILRPDRIIIGIGAVPNTALAEAAGLKIDNGIAVDEFLQTSDPDILAAGDCCSFPSPVYNRRVRLECWRNAQDQGNLVAANALGANESYTTTPWFWSDQFDLTLSVAGLPDPSLPASRRQLSPDAFILFQLGPDGTLLAASGLGIGNAVAKDIRLAEMMIRDRIKPDPAALADPETNLKKLLRG